MAKVNTLLKVIAEQVHIKLRSEKFKLFFRSPKILSPIYLIPG